MFTPKILGNRRVAAGVLFIFFLAYLLSRWHANAVIESLEAINTGDFKNIVFDNGSIQIGVPILARAKFWSGRGSVVWVAGSINLSGYKLIGYCEVSDGLVIEEFGDTLKLGWRCKDRGYR